MRIDSLKIQLAGDQEDHSVDSRQTREAASATLGRLEQAIDGLQKAVGLSRLRPRRDALHVRGDHSGHLLHGLDLGAHHAVAPMREDGATHFDALALPALKQLYLVDPGTRRAL